MTLTGRQIREGRPLAGMSELNLALAAGVGLELVIRAELAAHMSMLTRTDSAALEATGIEFTADPPGARLRNADDL